MADSYERQALAELQKATTTVSPTVVNNALARTQVLATLAAMASTDELMSSVDGHRGKLGRTV